MRLSLLDSLFLVIACLSEYVKPSKFLKEKEEIFNTILEAYNESNHPERVASIPWNSVKCIGWPEEVQSKLPKYWTPQDLVILRQNINNIRFRNRGRDATRMLEGTYSNMLFDSFTEKYRPLAVISSSPNNFILKCECRADSQLVAVKFIKKNALRFEERGVPMEVQLLSRVSHPGIVGLLDLFDDGDYIYLVMELAGTNWDLLNSKLTFYRNPNFSLFPHGNIHFERERPRHLQACVQFHSEMPEDTILFIFTQMYRVIVYLYRRKILYGDFSAENILVDADYHVKFVDFEYFMPIKRGWTYEPEDFAKIKPDSIKFTSDNLNPHLRAEQVAVRGLGELLYLMKRRHLPIQPSDLNFYPSSDCTGIFNLIKRMLHDDPDRRIGLESIASHPWMNRFQHPYLDEFKAPDEDNSTSAGCQCVIS